MADAIDHNFGTGIVTAGAEVGKWALLGALGIPLIAGLASGAGLGLALGWLAGSYTGGAAIFGAIAGFLGGGVTTAALTAPIMGPLAVGGGLLGLVRGGDRISRENQAYARRMNAGNGREDDMVSMQAAAAQRGYIQGVQEAMQQMQQAEMAQQQAPQQAPQVAASTAAAEPAKDDCKVCGPHTQAQADRAAKSAAAGQQVG